jgi:hypothetical protein
MTLIVRIRNHERGLQFRHGDYRRVLAPGRHILWSRLWSARRNTVDIVSTLSTRLEHKMLEAVLNAADPALASQLEVVNLSDSERAVAWRDGRVFAIVGPGRHAFWKTPYALKVERFDVESLRLAHPRLEAIVQHSDAAKWFDGVEVEAHEDVLLFRNGELIDRLGHGKHIFWKGAGRVKWTAVDRREQTADVAGQEIMTSDKVTLRVNLVVTYQVTDAAKAVTTVSDYSQSLYREAQLVLRASVGTRSIDALLADKETIGSEVRNALASRANEFGVAVRSVGLKDIILPGDMKAILNQVITAQKEAEANLVRRREETAAARSQANTAKLLADNPVLARFKELEILQSMLAGAKSTFVFGQGEMLENLRGLIRQDPVPENN